MKVELEMKERTLAKLARIVHTEGVKVGRELIQAREDWEAARDYHALMGNDVSERILGNSEALVSDLTDEARELLVLSRDLSRKAKAAWIGKSVDDHGHCSQ